MLYISKNELNQLLSDLPDHHEKGRTGRPAQAPKAARVARAVHHVDLESMKGGIPKEVSFAFG